MVDACERLFQLLCSEAGWPLPDGDLEDLTFAYRSSEIAFLRNESAQIDRIIKIRPISGLGRTLFVIDQGENDLSRFAIRRIAIHFSTRLQSWSSSPVMAVDQMVFFVISLQELVSVAHFQGSKALAATMAVGGTEPLNNCPAFLSQVAWEHFRTADWSLERQLYVRTERPRNQDRCSRRYLLGHCPSLVDLFDQACAVESITQAEEDYLFFHAQRGASWAVERIVEYNLRLVFDVAHRVCVANSACGVLFEDAFSGGIEGLMDAISKYEPDRGHRFRQLAWFWVSRTADRTMVESLWPVNIPNYVWEKAVKACRAFAIVKAVQEYPPVTQTLAESLGIVPDLVAVVRLLTRDLVDEVEVGVFDELPDQAAEHEYSLMMSLVSIPSYLVDLDIRERSVMCLRQGLHPQALGRELTLEQVANVYSVTRERVRQIEKRALTKLRQKGENAYT